jgi:UDP-glucose 6-dehydrogenase
MKASVIGLGKLGLPVAEAMAREHEIMGMDVRPVSTQMVRQGTLEQIVAHGDIIFIAVQTPHDAQYDGSAPTSHLPNKDFDYSTVISLLDQLDKLPTDGKTVVLISTVLPGTVRRQLAKHLTKASLIYNPYLIAMGTVAYDMVHPEMVMIGNATGRMDMAVQQLISFYKPLMKNNPRMVTGTWEEMECTKIFYNCYSQDTEVMTSSGWKLFPNISDTDEILSLNPESNTPEWVRPNKIVGRHHSGKMVHFSSSKDDILVTEEHRMYVGIPITRNKTRSHKWELSPAKDVVQRNYYAFIRSTNWHDTSPEHIDLGFARLPTELYVRFMAWYLSEGCISNGRVVISQDRNRNPDKHAMVKSMLDDIKIHLPCKNMVCESDTGCSILDNKLADYLHVFGKSHNKHVPATIKNLGRSMIRLFLDVYNMADGSAMPFRSFSDEKSGNGDNRRYRYYATSSDMMSSDLGELIVKVGRFPSYRKMVSPISGRDCHLVYELLQKTSIFAKHSSNGLKHSVIANYDGMVYCAMLPKNHVFMTRRNGKCTWQGNTFISAKLSLVNMIQDVAERVGNMDADTVARALAESTQRITGPAYMKPGMGDGGPCHPRDNIALRWLSEKLRLGYDLFDSIMRAREVQAENLARELVSHGLPVIILGKSFKPGVSYTDGSYSLLVAHYCEQLGSSVDYDQILSKPATYLLGHQRYYTTELAEMAQGSVVVDPWRSTQVPDGIMLIAYGNTRELVD